VCELPCSAVSLPGSLQVRNDAAAAAGYDSGPSQTVQPSRQAVLAG